MAATHRDKHVFTHASVVYFICIFFFKVNNSCEMHAPPVSGACRRSESGKSQERGGRVLRPWCRTIPGGLMS